MKIKMLKGAAGPMGNWCAHATYAVPDDMTLDYAEDFVRRGAAVWIEAPPVVEVAMDERTDIETADAPPRRRGRPRKAE